MTRDATARRAVVRFDTCRSRFGEAVAEPAKDARQVRSGAAGSDPLITAHTADAEARADQVAVTGGQQLELLLDDSPEVRAARPLMRPIALVLRFQLERGDATTALASTPRLADDLLRDPEGEPDGMRPRRVEAARDPRVEQPRHDLGKEILRRLWATPQVREEDSPPSLRTHDLAERCHAIQSPGDFPISPRRCAGFADDRLTDALHDATHREATRARLLRNVAIRQSDRADRDDVVAFMHAVLALFFLPLVAGPSSGPTRCTSVRCSDNERKPADVTRLVKSGHSGRPGDSGRQRLPADRSWRTSHMVGRAFKRAFLEACPLKDRERFFDWAFKQYGRGGGFRKQQYARLVRGEPVRAEYVTRVVCYLLDVTHDGNREALRFARYLDDAGIPQQERRCDRLIELLTEPQPIDLFIQGTTAVRDLFELIRDPTYGVRPCRDADEVREATRWLFVEGGRRARSRRLSESEAMTAGEAFVQMSFEEYAERLVQWWSAVPWSVTVGGDEPDQPVGMSIMAPLTSDEFALVRGGELDMFDHTLTSGRAPSDYLFIESMAPSCVKRPGFRLTPPLVHVFRALICQQAALSDIEGLGEVRPLHLLSLGCFEEFHGWLRRFGFTPTGAVTPLAGLQLWERISWSGEDSFRESAHLGVWRAIQRRLRGQPTSALADSGST